MPMVYQGSVQLQGFNNAIDALRFGESRTSRITRSHSCDVRLAWDRPEPLLEASKYLDANFDGYWMDAAVHADPRELQRYFGWAETMVSGSLTLGSLEPERENSVMLELPGLQAVRFDDKRLGAQDGDSEWARISVRYIEDEKRLNPARTRLELAASRTKTAFDELAMRIGSQTTRFSDFMKGMGAGESEWLMAPKAKITPWLSGPFDATRPLPIDLQLMKTHIVQSCPLGLSIEQSAGGRQDAIEIWRIWLSLLDQLDVLRIRCMGTRRQIMDILDQVDLFPYHPVLPHHHFGISTYKRDSSPEVSQIQELLAAPELSFVMADWDLLWSGLELESAQITPQSLEENNCRYVVRSEGQKTTDRLYLSLNVADPQSDEFRAMRRRLASTFGAPVNVESAWQFDGPFLETPAGWRFERLRTAVAQLPEQILAETEPVHPPTAKPVKEALENLIALFARNGKGQTSFAQRLSEVVSAALPGFRYDRKAHLTDHYFMVFVRHTTGGVHHLQFQRLYRPNGFSIRLGVSTVNVHIDDLIPAVGRTAPGLMMPIAALLPERDEPYWTFNGHASENRVLADTGQILSTKVARFFEEAELALQAFAKGAFD